MDNIELEKKIEQARLEGRIEASLYFRGFMISTSPFISQKLNPYLTEQRQKLKEITKEGSNDERS